MLLVLLLVPAAVVGYAGAALAVEAYHWLRLLRYDRKWSIRI